MESPLKKQRTESPRASVDEDSDECAECVALEQELNELQTTHDEEVESYKVRISELEEADCERCQSMEADCDDRVQQIRSEQVEQAETLDNCQACISSNIDELLGRLPGLVEREFWASDDNLNYLVSHACDIIYGLMEDLREARAQGAMAMELVSKSVEDRMAELKGALKEDSEEPTRASIITKDHERAGAQEAEDGTQRQEPTGGGAEAVPDPHDRRDG